MQRKKRESLLLMILTLYMLAGCVGTPKKEGSDPAGGTAEVEVIAETQPVIVFTDPAIEAETRCILGKPSGGVTREDVLGITEFEKCSGCEASPHSTERATDLTDLRWFENLRVLDLPGCNIYSLRGVEELADLERINVRDMTYLGLRNNLVSEIGALYALTKLENMDITQNPVKEEEVQRYFEPRASDYWTVEYRERINDNMPEFLFSLDVFYDRREGNYRLLTLSVSDAKDKTLIQTISIPELTFFGETAISKYEDGMGFELEDLNFDGYLDVRLLDTPNGNYMMEWIYLVWAPGKRQFVNDRRLNKIPLAQFDQEKQLIYGSERGSACDHWLYTYQYVDGEIRQIAEMSDNLYLSCEAEEVKQLVRLLPPLTDSHLAFQRYIERKQNKETGGFEVTDDYFYTDIGGEQYRYSADSDVGKMILEIMNQEETTAE